MTAKSARTAPFKIWYKWFERFIKILNGLTFLIGKMVEKYTMKTKGMGKNPKMVGIPYR